MLDVLLWASLAMLVYIYAGYPLLAIALGRRSRRRILIGEEYPSVTWIVTAYNEEKHIGDKIRNILALNYPQDGIDIIVASDASSDGTDDIVRELGASNGYPA